MARRAGYEDPWRLWLVSLQGTSIEPPADGIGVGDSHRCWGVVWLRLPGDKHGLDDTFTISKPLLWPLAKRQVESVNTDAIISDGWAWRKGLYASRACVRYMQTVVGYDCWS